MERAHHQASQTPETDTPVSVLLSALAPPPAPVTPDPDQLRTTLLHHLSSQQRQLRTANRLLAALDRSGVAARTGRLEQTERGVRPELKAVQRQWEERKGPRPVQDSLWVMMMTAPARVEATVLEAERNAAAELAGPG